MKEIQRTRQRKEGSAVCPSALCSKPCKASFQGERAALDVKHIELEFVVVTMQYNFNFNRIEQGSLLDLDQGNQWQSPSVSAGR